MRRSNSASDPSHIPQSGKMSVRFHLCSSPISARIRLRRGAVVVIPTDHNGGRRLKKANRPKGSKLRAERPKAEKRAEADMDTLTVNSAAGSLGWESADLLPTVAVIIPRTRWRIHVEAPTFRLSVRRPHRPGAAGIADYRSVADDDADRDRVRGTSFPIDRTGDDVGPHLGCRRVRAEPRDLLRWHGARRRVENREQRDAVRGA